MTDQEYGKWWEGEFWKALPDVKGGFLYKHRFVDATKAMSLTAGKAPADFLLGWQGRGFHLELKASRTKETLRSCFSYVDDNQVANLYGWLLSGNPGGVLFLSELTDLVHVWPARIIVQQRHAGKPLPKNVPMMFVRKDLDKQLPNALDLMAGDVR